MRARRVSAPGSAASSSPVMRPAEVGHRLRQRVARDRASAAARARREQDRAQRHRSAPASPAPFAGERRERNEMVPAVLGARPRELPSGIGGASMSRSSERERPATSCTRRRSRARAAALGRFAERRAGVTMPFQKSEISASERTRVPDALGASLLEAVARMVVAQARVNGETEDLRDQRLHPVGQRLACRAGSVPRQAR